MRESICSWGLARSSVLGSCGLATKAAGQKVVARDLRGHGADSTPLAARPYELYVPSLCKVLEDLDDPAILVGHSSGGVIISEAAARA